MELAAVRTIDELGRIILPKEARQAKGWGEGTKIAIYSNNDVLVLERYTPPEEQDNTNKFD